MTVDSLSRGGPERYALWAAGLGVLDLLVARLLPGGVAASTLSLLISLALLAVAALAGLAASRRGQRPGWAGALPGLVYGLVSGLDAFYQRVSLSDARTIVQHESASGARLTPEQFMQAANAPSTHLFQFLIGALFLAVFGIIVGSLAVMFVRRFLPALARGQG